MDTVVTGDEIRLNDAVSAARAVPRPETVDFDSWVAARGAELLRFAYVVTGSQVAAEDALQTALAKAYERWSRVSTVDNPDAYVRRMIVNAHVSWWRRYRRRESPSDAFEVVDLVDDPADRWSTTDIVWQACLELPPRQRVAVVLRFYEDLPYAEIAQVMKCAEPTARSYVHRGLATLRLAIEEEDDRDD